MKYFLTFLIGTVFISFIACKSTDNSTDNGMNKLNAASNFQLLKAEKEDPNKKLQLLIQLNEDANDETMDILKENNIVVITKVGRIITASANAETVRNIIKLKLVKQIEINGSKSIK